MSDFLEGLSESVEAGLKDLHGSVVRWDDERGFGFIAPKRGGRDVFVHVKAFPAGSRRPAAGDKVLYFELMDLQGCPRAWKARLASPGLPPGVALYACFLLLFFLALLGGIVFLDVFPRYFIWMYLLMSMLTYRKYRGDKLAAQNKEWRTPENTLHFMSLLGGWPGALLAQQILRHKSSKTAFRSVFWVTVVMNLGVLGFLGSKSGASVVALCDRVVFIIVGIVSAVLKDLWSFAMTLLST